MSSGDVIIDRSSSESSPASESKNSRHDVAVSSQPSVVRAEARPPPSTMAVDNEKDLTSLMNLRYKKLKGHDGLENKSELDMYLDEVYVGDIDDPSFDILAWWKANATRYRVLSRMAKDVLAMPVFTVASESAFSMGGRVLDAFRSSLTSRIAEALICNQDWLKSSLVPINLEENLEELERMKFELPHMALDHPSIVIDD
ncbi:hypothetical protein Dimus_039070 [Dionaea muscipula]